MQFGTKKAIWKKWFFRFSTKIAADTGFQVQNWKKRKNTTQNKSLFKIVNFSSIFGNLSEIFWIIDITFLFSLLLLQNWWDVVGRKRENVLQLSDFLCLEPEIWYFTCEKWPKSP